ncbi:DgyrCDS11949 [Dimorphilus gyrociliatus]|uniref:DgyrCDS11949 n=1 Tax=Dimorphilus gyrociliatus TaxID=2664684 RepID=A0A7I8W549_9ANNE|nr:DgyrCDS11949 [Dimorphilus gyrociliatus]
MTAFYSNYILEQQTVKSISVGFIVLVGVVLVKKVFQRKKYKLPPGPLPLPIVGNLLQIFRVKKRFHEHLLDISKQYGPVIWMKIGGWNTVFLNDINVIREALMKDYDFAGRPKFPSAMRITKGKDILFGDVSDVWKFHRKLAHSSIRSYASGKKLDDLVNRVVQNCCDLMLQEKKPFEMHTFCGLFVFNWLFGIIFGKEKDVKDPDFVNLKDLTQEALDAFASGSTADIFPVLDYLSFGENKLDKTINKLCRVLEREMNEHLETFDENNLRDIMDYMICAQKQVNLEERKELLSDEHVKMICFDMFGAGVDTVLSSLHWYFGLIIQHQNVQEKLHKEIDEKLGSLSPSIESRSKLVYTEASIMEQLRYGTLALLGVPLSTIRDTTVGGYDIPKDTMVLINIGGLHENNELWGDAENYRPERFIADDGTLIEKPRHFMPFGIGKRNCLGEVLAKNTLGTAIPAFLQRLNFLPPEDGQPFVAKNLGSSLANLCEKYKCRVEERH